MLNDAYPLYLANTPREPNTALPVHNKYNGEIVTRVAKADARMVEDAIQAAVNAKDAMRRLPPWKRADVLNHCVTRFEERQQELAEARRAAQRIINDN